MLILLISQAVGLDEWNVPFSSKGLGHLCPLSYISVQKNNRFALNRTTVLIRTQAALQHRGGMVQWKMLRKIHTSHNSHFILWVKNVKSPSSTSETHSFSTGKYMQMDTQIASVF